MHTCMHISVWCARCHHCHQPANSPTSAHRPCGTPNACPCPHSHRIPTPAMPFLSYHFTIACQSRAFPRLDSCIGTLQMRILTLFVERFETAGPICFGSLPCPSGVQNLPKIVSQYNNDPVIRLPLMGPYQTCQTTLPMLLIPPQLVTVIPL